MAVKLSVAAVTASLQGLLTATEAGPAAPKLNIYSGIVPATATESVGSSILLVSFDLDDPAWDPIENDAAYVFADAAPVTPVTAAADGTATFYRILDGNGAPVLQGTVTTVGGGGDAELSAVDIISGIEVTVVSLRLRQRYLPA